MHTWPTANISSETSAAAPSCLAWLCLCLACSCLCLACLCPAHICYPGARVQGPGAVLSVLPLSRYSIADMVILPWFDLLRNSKSSVDGAPLFAARSLLMPALLGRFVWASRGAKHVCPRFVVLLSAVVHYSMTYVYHVCI